VKTADGTKTLIPAGSPLTLNVSNGINTGYSYTNKTIYLQAQPGTNGIYGSFAAILTLTVDNVDHVSSAIPYELVNTGTLSGAITAAQAQAAKTSRFTDDYIKRLNNLITDAQKLLVIGNVSKEVIQSKIDELNNAVKYLNADGTGPLSAVTTDAGGNKIPDGYNSDGSVKFKEAPIKIWKLTFEWLDNILGQAFIIGYWKIFDALTGKIPIINLSPVEIFGKIPWDTLFAALVKGITALVTLAL
jgi:hypothetical protein